MIFRKKIAGARTNVHATAGSHDDPRELGSLSFGCVLKVRAGLPCGVGQEITLLKTMLQNSIDAPPHMPHDRADYNPSWIESCEGPAPPA